MNLCISLMHDGQEVEYNEFPVTEDGLKAAKELLAMRMQNRYFRRISPWQFKDPWNGDLMAARKALRDCDVGTIRKLLEKHR